MGRTQSKVPASIDVLHAVVLVEVQMAMRREAIDSVDTIFGMHLGPTPWSEVEATIVAVRRGTTEKPRR